MQNIKHVGMSLFDLGWNLGAWWDGLGSTGRAIVAVALILASVKALHKLNVFLHRRFMGNGAMPKPGEFEEFYLDLHAQTGDLFSQGEARSLCQRLIDNPELSEQVRIPALARAEERGEG